MVEIIPAILEKNRAEVITAIKKVESYVDWVQFDVMDGIFVTNNTWDLPDANFAENFSVKMEAHLMIANPALKIGDWLKAGVKRIIIQREAINDADFSVVAKKCAAAGVEVGIALSPRISALTIGKIISFINIVLCLGVDPGFSGQVFQSGVLEKISWLRKNNSRLKIEADGGINKKTAREAIAAGADILVSRSYIFDSDNPEERIKELKNIKI